MDCDPARKELFVATCNDESVTQRWKFERFNKTGIKSYAFSIVSYSLWLWFLYFKTGYPLQAEAVAVGIGYITQHNLKGKLASNSNSQWPV